MQVPCVNVNLATIVFNFTKVDYWYSGLKIKFIDSLGYRQLSEEMKVKKFPNRLRTLSKYVFSAQNPE